MLSSRFSSKNLKIISSIFVLLTISIYDVVGRKCICTSKACKEAGIEVCRTRFSCYTEEIYDIDGNSRDNTSTRGCTEGATPLLCEANAWKKSSKRDSRLLINIGNIPNDSNIVSTPTTKQELVWPRLKCCNTHDFCNSIVTDRTKENDRGLENSRSKSTKNIVGYKNSQTLGETVSESIVSSKDREEETIETTKRSVYSIETEDRETDSTRTIVPDFEDREKSYDPLRHRVKPLHVAVVVLAIAALTSVLGACYVITRFLRNPFDVGSP